MHFLCPGESFWTAFGVFGEPLVPQLTNFPLLGTTQAEKSWDHDVKMFCFRMQSANGAATTCEMFRKHCAYHAFWKEPLLQILQEKCDPELLKVSFWDAFWYHVTPH